MKVLRLVEEYGLLFVMGEHTFQITSNNFIYLYPPPLVSITIVVHVRATGRRLSWNTNFVKLTSISHHCVAGSIPVSLPLSTPSYALPSFLVDLPTTPCVVPVLTLKYPPLQGVRLGFLYQFVQIFVFILYFCHAFHISQILYSELFIYIYRVEN